MHVTHSRALAAAVVALSTCAGATHLGSRATEQAPRPAALVAVRAPVPAPVADSIAIAPADASATQ